jgi:hydroxyacylglutathione hydrolase
MPLTVHLVPCLEDNYGFLVRDQTSGEVAAVDTPDAAQIVSALDRLGWHLTTIFNTHKHGDHIGGNEDLRRRTGAKVVGPAEVADRTHVDRIVAGGDTVWLGETEFEVLDTGGHTLGHVSYYARPDNVAFVGDALFAMGCGRLFEGTPDQMWASLRRLAELPQETRIYCAHEYTAANARFAVTVDDAPHVRERAEAIFEIRARTDPTVPTTVALERSTNPFLRAPALRPQLSPVAAFAELRRAKDSFCG